MIGYLLILVYTVLNLGESLIVKEYAKRHGNGGMLMNAFIALFAAAFFLVTDLINTDGFYAPGAMIPLAIINALLYAAGFYFTYVAFRIGPFGLTRLISSFSLLFSIFYGIFFLKEPTNALTYIGLVLIFLAMFLINYTGKFKLPTKKSTADAADEKAPEEKKSEENGISLKWLIYLLISVFSNGFIAILTRMQQIKFDNACSNEFQMISIGGSFVLLAVIGLITDRDKLRYILKNGTLYGIGAGICNGAKNFTTLAIFLFLPLSIVSPVKTSLSMITAFLVSVLFYKEKYSLRQKIGVLFGTVAIVLLAI